MNYFLIKVIFSPFLYFLKIGAIKVCIYFVILIILDGKTWEKRPYNIFMEKIIKLSYALIEGFIKAYLLFGID